MIVSKISLRSCSVGLSILALAALPQAFAFDEEAFQARAQQLIDDLSSQPVPAPGGTGKLPYGRVIAHLVKSGGTDEAAHAFIAESGYAGEIFFNSLMQVRALYLAKDYMSQARLDLVRTQASAADNNWGNTGTENHRKMTWSSGYLLAQLFPNAQWNWGGETISSAELMSRVKANLSMVGRNEIRSGYSEFLSPNYLIYHVAPMLNLFDYAEDPEMRAIAEASLLYHFGTLAMGSFNEVILPPWSRRAQTMDRNVSGVFSQFLLWLVYGHGNIEAGRQFDTTLPLVFFAISDWRPQPLFMDISQRNVEFPYTFRTQQPHFQWSPLRYVMRTTHHHQRYAMSSGVIRHIPGAFMLDDAQFMIAWEGSAPVRQISAFHPYWRVVTVGENYWLAPTSPFMQTGQADNAAIMLFNIPAEDPWPREGRQEWWIHRDGPIMPLAQARFPAHMTYSAGPDNWVFLRDGGVYVAIKVLKDGWIRDRRSVSEAIGGSPIAFHVLKSRGTVGEPWQSGFIFEIGSVDEFGSFEAFQAAVSANPVVVNWSTLTVQYTKTDGRVLELRYNTSSETPDLTIPLFSVDGTAVNYDATWPSFQSPWTSVEGDVMHITDHGRDQVTVDWSGDVPAISREVIEAPEWAGYPIPANGWVDTGAFMGHVYPQGDYIWSESLADWAYAPASAMSTEGIWIYVFK